MCRHIETAYEYKYELVICENREETIPTICNNINDLLSNPDVNYWLLSRHVSGIFMPIIRRKDRITVFCWYCWMWLVAVLWCYVEGVSTVKVAARAATFTVLTPYNVAPQPATSNTTSKKSIRSNTWSFLLMMGTKMPETCRERSQ